LCEVGPNNIRKYNIVDMNNEIERLYKYVSILQELHPSSVDVCLPDFVHSTQTHRPNDDDHEQTNDNDQHLKEVVPHGCLHTSLYTFNRR